MIFMKSDQENFLFLIPSILEEKKRTHDEHHLETQRQDIEEVLKCMHEKFIVGKESPIF